MPDGQVIAAKIALVGIIAGLTALVRPERLLRYSCLTVMAGSFVGLLIVAGKMLSGGVVTPAHAQNAGDVSLAPEPVPVSSPPPPPAAAPSEDGVAALLGEWTCDLPYDAKRHLRFEDENVVFETVNNGRERRLSYRLTDPEHIVIRRQGREVTHTLSGMGPERRLKYRRSRREIVCAPDSLP